MSCAIQTLNGYSQVENPEAIALGQIDQIPPGQGRCFKVGARQIALFRQRDGSLFALDPRCPHLGGPLADGLIGAGVVICPLHAYRFRLCDGVGVDQDLTVQSYPVEVREGCIFVQPVGEV